MGFAHMVTGFLAILYFCGAAAVQAGMPVQTRDGGRTTGPQIVKKVSEKGSGPTASVRKRTEFIQKLEGQVLYTEGGRYSLSGVKVMDMTAGGTGDSDSSIRKTAEMTFFNKQLREVVIRQRK